MTKISPIQKIIFGSPGTGKSHEALVKAEDNLKIPNAKTTKISPYIIKTVFHPEYTHHDFIGKLLPQTDGNNIIYKFYPGHFLRAIAKAYQSLLEGKDEQFLLVIDELNRGNAAAIFGSIFQLLDRDDDGWSSYTVEISDIELGGILNLIGISTQINNGRLLVKKESEHTTITTTINDFFKLNQTEINKYICKNSDKIKPDKVKDSSFEKVSSYLSNHCISIPHNLSIIATINTSDESIYYLDSAFKRRWDWEYIEAPHGNLSKYVPSKEHINIPEQILHCEVKYGKDKFSVNLPYLILAVNNFIRSNSQSIRGVEDKQIGWWFIKPNQNKLDNSEDSANIIEIEQIQDKLMFYLWDNVFARDKSCLTKLLKNEGSDNFDLITYADFVKHTKLFIKLVIEKHLK